MLDHEWRPRKYYLELWKKILVQIVLPTQNKNQSWLNNQSQWKWDRSIIKLIGMLRLRMYGWVERAKKWHLPVRHNKEWFFMFFHFWMCAVRYHEEGSWNSTQFCTLNATSIRKVRNPTKSMKNSMDPILLCHLGVWNLSVIGLIWEVSYWIDAYWLLILLS